MRQLDFALRQRIRIDREIVVVGGDLDLARLELLDRMITAVVSELQLERLAAQRNSNQLMSEADSEDRLPSHQPSNAIHRVCTRLGIARAIRQKHAVRFQSP